MVADEYGGVQDLAFPSEASKSEFTHKLGELLRMLAFHTRSMMDLRELGGNFRFARTSFQSLSAFAFPLVGGRVLCLAIESKNLYSGKVSRVFEFLKVLDEDSPIDDKEVVDSMLAEINFSNKPAKAQNISPPPQIPIDRAVLDNRKKSRIVRSQNEIIISILNSCKTPSVQHSVMIKSRLGYETFWTHVNRLIDEGMITSSSDGKKVSYLMTERGRILLGKLLTSGNVSKFIA